jgi:hypothetical protein
MTVIFNSQTLPYRAEFSLAGTGCLLSTNSTAVLQIVMDLRNQEPHCSASILHMEVIVDDSLLDRSSNRPPHFRGLHHVVFVDFPGRSFVTYDLQRRKAHALLSNEAARDASFWNALLLPITIGVLGTTVGVAPLHCACVDQNGVGFLVAGMSGAGKSTLATALAQRGYALVSDDWTYVSRQGTNLLAHGLSAHVKLLPDAVRFFPELRPLEPKTALNGELAYEVDPQRFLGVSVRTVSIPQQLFFLQRTSHPGCDLIPLEPQYVTDFFEKSGERLPTELVEARALRSEIIHLLSGLPAWTLRTGENPHVTAEVLADFVVEHEHARA